MTTATTSKADVTRAWEENYDEPSQTFLASLDLGAEPALLDLGAGGGSMGAWFRGRYPAGSVVALDADVTDLGDLARMPGVEVVRADACQHTFAPQSFDVIFARAVFSVLRQPAAMLDRCRSWLRPGGWLVVEDFYFMDHAQATTELGRTVLEGYLQANADAGADFSLARRLPALLADAGLQDVRLQVRPLGPGQGSSENKLMEMRMRAEGSSLVRRGLLTQEQIDQWIARLDDPTFQDITALGIRTWGRCP